MKDMKTLRYLVEMQGYTGQSDQAIREFAPWLRLAPATCATVVGTSTFLGEWKLLALMIPLAVLGVILPHHPLDSVYQILVAPARGTAPIPESGAPRRFSCAMGAAWVTVTAFAFAGGDVALGQLLGWAFTATALIPVLTGLCVPSLIWTHVLRQPVAKGIRLERLPT